MPAALQRYVSLWIQSEHGTPVDTADALAVEQVPLLIAAVQGYVIQRSLLDDFDGDGYLAAVEKYLPR